jgi:hypothetical protein
MSEISKRSFTSFVNPAAVQANKQAPSQNGIVQPLIAAPIIPEVGPPQANPEAMASGTEAARYGSEPGAGHGGGVPERVRVVTTTGRIRTYTASRNLPGVTLRLTEQRWERLKMLSIQERRPIQEILGEALDDYMRARGLPW